jgi:hypothetical protein
MSAVQRLQQSAPDQAIGVNNITHGGGLEAAAKTAPMCLLDKRDQGSHHRENGPGRVAVLWQETLPQYLFYVCALCCMCAGQRYTGACCELVAGPVQLLVPRTWIHRCAGPLIPHISRMVVLLDQPLTAVEWDASGCFTAVCADPTDS